MATDIKPKTVNVLHPITALAFLRLGTSKRYLLAGEGQLLKVFDDEGRALIHTERVFDLQAIHGIVCKCLPQHAGVLLIWGGRSVCLVSIEVDVDPEGKPLVSTHQIMSETIWDDWILDGCFLQAGVTASRPGRNPVEAMLVTAHNDLVGLQFKAKAAEKIGGRWLYRIASGPSSILYSAHMLWADAGRCLLVAAGTVFGEVLLWSLDLMSSEIFVRYRYTGHEGSIFGVRISDVAQTGAVRRILASCSDDRTIRIWNVSETVSRDRANHLFEGDLAKSEHDLLEAGNKADSTGCLAVIMGHTSRIWGLRFVNQEDGRWDLISHGEDSTAQAWRVVPVPGKGRTFATPRKDAYKLSHQNTYSYHSGKNLWAMAVFQETDDDCVIATGGADGRIAIYESCLNGMPARTNAWTSQYTMDEVSKGFQSTHTELSSRGVANEKSFTWKIFDSLKGSWKLSRKLDSVLSTYPSGTLQGTATFVDRSPTDDEYEAECLYSESGDFMTQQGLKMKATRQYVYRYRKSTDTISVWFVKPDDSSAVDYFFHQLDFRDTDPGVDRGGEVLTASGYHLCVKDNYNASYSFQMKNSKLTQWHAIFDVDGPKKGYIAKATYTREQAERVEPEDIPPSTSNNHMAVDNQSLQKDTDAFKTYTLLAENIVLATTEKGNLLIGTLTSETGASSLSCSGNVKWEHVGHQIGLVSSCIATCISSLSVSLLTGTDGTVYFYSHRRREVGTIGKLPGKAGFLRAHVLSLQWNRWLQVSDRREVVGLFATCLGSSRATVFMLLPPVYNDGQSTEEDAGLLNIIDYYISLPPKFIVTSSCFLETEEWIILGSRNGDLAIYDLVHTTPDIAVTLYPKCFSGIHGEDAITLIQNVPRTGAKSKGRAAIITAGRDGKWAIHRVFYRPEKGGLTVTLDTIHVGVPPFGPNIEGACIDSTDKDLFLWGFRSKQFVVWNESQKTEVMAVDCGGAHRNWAYIPKQNCSEGGTFVYTKASVCHLHSQERASHQVIQHGGHGREIKAMAVSPVFKTDDGIEHRFVATGAEDTDIRIFDLHASFKCLSIITKHTTGMQQLHWSPNGRLLFSAAGCEEFLAWRLQSAPLVTVGVVCEAQCPTVTEEADLRIMDFALEEIHTDHVPDDDAEYEPSYLLSMVYSDSSVRMFRYHHTSTSTNHFELLSQGSYTTHCLTRATHLHLHADPDQKTHPSRLLLLCTASTDGHLAFWPLPRLSHPSQPQPPTTTILPPSILQHTARSPMIHQNSIKALTTLALSTSETLIVTGGDDGALALTRVWTRLYPSPSSITERKGEGEGKEKEEEEQQSIFDTSTLLLPNAHASAVTGVILLHTNKSEPNHNPNTTTTLHSQHQSQPHNSSPTPTPSLSPSPSLILTLASTSNDQRLKIWQLRVDTAAAAAAQVGGAEGIGVDIKKVKDVYTGVADASSLGVYHDRDGDDDGEERDGYGDYGEEADRKGRREVCVLVAGIGVERWRV